VSPEVLARLIPKVYVRACLALVMVHERRILGKQAAEMQEKRRSILPNFLRRSRSRSHSQAQTDKRSRERSRSGAAGNEGNGSPSFPPELDDGLEGAYAIIRDEYADAPWQYDGKYDNDVELEAAMQQQQQHEAAAAATGGNTHFRVVGAAEPASAAAAESAHAAGPAPGSAASVSDGRDARAGTGSDVLAAPAGALTASKPSDDSNRWDLSLGLGKRLSLVAHVAGAAAGAAADAAAGVAANVADTLVLSTAGGRGRRISLSRTAVPVADNISLLLRRPSAPILINAFQQRHITTVPTFELLPEKALADFGAASSLRWVTRTETDMDVAALVDALTHAHELQIDTDTHVGSGSNETNGYIERYSDESASRSPANASAHGHRLVVRDTNIRTFPSPTADATPASPISRIRGQNKVAPDVSTPTLALEHTDTDAIAVATPRSSPQPSQTRHGHTGSHADFQASLTLAKTQALNSEPGTYTFHNPRLRSIFQASIGYEVKQLSLVAETAKQAAAAAVARASVRLGLNAAASAVGIDDDLAQLLEEPSSSGKARRADYFCDLQPVSMWALPLPFAKMLRSERYAISRKQIIQAIAKK
jgi:site-specific DNA-cytosine methylase